MTVESHSKGLLQAEPESLRMAVNGGLLTKVLLIGLVSLALGSCGADQNASSDSTIPSSPTVAPSVRFTNENWHLVLAEAKGRQKAYVGSPVSVAGKVVQVISRSTDQTRLTIETDIYEQVTVIVLPRAVEVTEGDWVRISGHVRQYWSTKSLIKGFNVPVVLATDLSTASRSDAHPSIVNVEPLDTVEQHALWITLQKVEIADRETRVFVEVYNGNLHTARLSTINAVLIQGDREIVRKRLWTETIKEPDTMLYSGSTTEGVILFEGVDPEGPPVKFVWSNPRTDDWYVHFDDWIWEFEWPVPFPIRTTP